MVRCAAQRSLEPRGRGTAASGHAPWFGGGNAAHLTEGYWVALNPQRIHHRNGGVKLHAALGAAFHGFFVLAP